MGDCGIIMQTANFETSAAQGVYDARDIARRFEQLETQWMSFQKNSTKLEADKDNIQKLSTNPTRNHLPSDAVSSAASSYSNPLFTNHSVAKPAQASGDRTSSSSSRTWNICTDLKPDKSPFSCIRQRKAGALSKSPTDATTTKDDHSSSLVSPSLLGSSCQNSETAFIDGHAPPSIESMVTRATVATFFRAKPPLGPAVQTISKAPKIGNENYESRATSVTRQTCRKNRKERQRSFKLPEILGLDRPQLRTSMTRSLMGDDFHESAEDMIESLRSVTYPSISDPATYPSGNEWSESYQSSDLEHSAGAHVNELRSSPSPSHTSTTVADLQLNPLLGYDGVSDRNISWRVLGDRGVLTEGSFKMDRHPAEHHDAQSNSHEENNISNGMLVQNSTEVSPKDGNLLKLEVQIGQKNVLEPDHVTLGDRLDKVNWELRLSKREAALRIAEEKLLEEEQNIFQARLAVSRCEDALHKREQDVQVELEKQKIDIGESLKSLETGKTVMQNLCTGLRDVLWHLELKENVFQNTWVKLKGSVDSTSVLGDHSFGFEPELSLKDRGNGTFNSISFLIVEGKGEEWCSTVVGICERLVSYMSRETHLQKWAVVLEREGMRMSNMTIEMAKAKEVANEQCARSEDMMKCAEEQAACMDEERVKLARERDNLILWVTHLQERRKAVAECEREAAKSLTEVQKKAADLFVHESDIDDRALETYALQEELRVTSQRLQDDQELINREKHKVQEKMRQVAGRESEVESKISAMKKLQEDLNSKAEQLEKDRIDEKRKEILLLTLHEAEERLNAKEISISELEKELKLKVAAVDERANSINDREKLLSEVQLHTEQERSKMLELMTVLEKEKVRLKEAEEAVVEAHSSKKSAEDAWVRTAQERRESSEYLRSIEDRLKQWEDKLCSKEKELKGQQKKLQVIEDHAREEQEQSEALHAKMIQEQESWTQELKVKQESLSKRNQALDAKEEEITNDLERLTEERRVVLEDIKRLAEVEARARGAERNLQTKYDDHLKEVRKHASEYNTQVEDLALAKREVKRELVELRAKKQELKIWQREAEETLQNRIDSFVKGKEELTSQIKELKKLQMDIEQAGSQIIDRVAELDQASSRLERQRYKVEISKKKLEAIADKLATHQEILKRREYEFLTQESKLLAVQNGLKKMAAEAATKEKNLRCREQAVIDGENDLYDVEARLSNERKDLETMLAEVEQHAAKLKEETTPVEEIIRSRTCDDLVHEERQENLQEKELAEFETDLQTKDISAKRHGQNIWKLEMQVKGRLPRAVELETKSEQLEKGRENFATEREALNRTKAEIQRKAENDEVQRQVYSEMLEEKRKVEMLEGPCAQEATVESCEIKATGQETLLLQMELNSKCCEGQYERSPQKLQQLHSACTQIEDRRRYVEEACNAAKTVTAVLQESDSKFRLKDQDLAKREIIDLYQGLHGGDSHEKLEGSWSNVVGGSADFQHQTQSLEMQQPGPRVNVADWVSKSDRREARFGFQHVSEEQRTKHILVCNQMDEGLENKLKHMEEAFQKEAAKISQERANLKLQQQELEETRKAVEEVKLTLETQLKATKQMVAGASLTAQNAYREREALEEERKRLAQDRKDAEASVVANEENLAMEAKHIETMKSMLEQEKTKAMEMIQRITKNAMNAEHGKGESSSAQWDSILLHKESQFEASLKDREKELISTSETIQRDKTNLEVDRAQVKILHDAIEREPMEHPYAILRNTTKADGVRNDAENQMAWKKMNRERIIGEANCWDPTSEGSSNYMSNVGEQEFSFSAMKSATEIDGAIADFGEGSGGSIHTCCELANSKTSNIEWDEAFGSSISSTNATYNHVTPEKMNIYSSSCKILEKNDVPSLKRLENVMTSLTYARQASRSRLQRTKNALLAFPPSSGFISQVQQALNALSARLSLMEQVEEGLESHLRKAYEIELPESEGVLFDKVQLLCRLEEQQSLRAEWEEDMQRQLETISILQAPCGSSPSFSSPPRDSHEGVLPVNDWQNHSRNMYQGGKGLGSYEITSGGGYTEVNSSGDLHNGKMLGQSKQFSNLNWNKVFERGNYFDSTGLSNFPFVAYDCLSSPPDQHANEFGTDGLKTRERITRRKLLLTPPRVTYS